jgi:hypothetical protein
MQVNGNVLRINSANGQVGSVWFTKLQPVSEGFSTTFRFQTALPTQIPDGPPPPPFPADGFAFVIENSASGLKAPGQGGGAIGYGSLGDASGIDNGATIEFDTFADESDLVGDINGPTGQMGGRS